MWDEQFQREQQRRDMWNNYWDQNLPKPWQAGSAGGAPGGVYIDSKAMLLGFLGVPAGAWVADLIGRNVVVGGGVGFVVFLTLGTAVRSLRTLVLLLLALPGFVAGAWVAFTLGANLLAGAALGFGLFVFVLFGQRKVSAFARTAIGKYPVAFFAGLGALSMASLGAWFSTTLGDPMTLGGSRFGVIGGVLGLFAGLLVRRLQTTLSHRPCSRERSVP
ncbi:MAG: hypothetical protein HYX27_14700 [Acidobacteria bacterium]|nr:hypothetical protein [Acidobacteriota bacterium]